LVYQQNRTVLILQSECATIVRMCQVLITLPLVPQLSHTKEMIEHPPDQKIQLFSFGSKTDGKKVSKLCVQKNVMYPYT